jgi:pimeloyl-ACP methyl ester carboxylesterase
MQEQEKRRGPLVEKLWESLAEVKAPVLLLRGQASAVLTQAMAESLIENTLREGELRTVSRSGHALMIDNPQECSACISEFLGQRSQISQSIRRAS